MHGPIADQQHGIGVARFEPVADRQRLQLRLDSKSFAEQNPHQCRAGPRTFVERQPADPLRRHAAKQLHAQHRPAAGNASVRHDPIIGILKKLDRRNQRHIQAARRQPIGQPAGQIEHDIRLRRKPIEPIDERLGVQIINGPDAEPSGTVHGTSFLNRVVSTDYMPGW